MDKKAGTRVGVQKQVYARRRSKRLLIEVSLIVNHPRMSRQVAAELFDLSPLGCRFLSEESFETGAQVLICIEGMEDWPGTVVWSGPEGIGVDFHAPLNATVVEQYARNFPRGDAAAEPSG